MAAGKLVRHIVLFTTEMETLEDFVGGLFAAGFAIAGVNQGKGNIVENVDSRDEVEVLKNEADAVGADFSLFATTEAINRLTVEKIGTEGGTVEQADDV